MNVVTYSPALALLYVYALLWILMGIDMKSFSRKERWVLPIVTVFLCFVNDLLRKLIGYAVYGKLLFLCMHLPTFFLFLYIAKRGIIKTAFMILTALVFTAPTVIIGNAVRYYLFVDSPLAFLLSNVISYIVMLLLAWFIFRRGFSYLLIYGNSQFFLIFSILPIVFYIYMLVAVNQDFSSLDSLAGYVVRWIPIIEAFSFYFLIPYIYQSLREKMLIQSAQDALKQEISSAENQITLLNEVNTQMAVYRHDVRHQAILLNGLLAGGNTEQAQEVLKTAIADLDAITLKRYCENETINLLCSSYDNKAKQLGVQMKINTQLPKVISLSDIELCSMVSNGLENALCAVSQLAVPDKWIAFSCYIRQNKVFMQIQNPYAGKVIIRDGLPVSSREGHGYGCYSIQTITQRNGGLCSFEANDGLFSLRLFFPLGVDSK